MDQGTTHRVGEYHPWRRYFAKFIDFVTLGFPAVALLLFVLDSATQGQIEELGTHPGIPFVYGVLLTWLWVPVEALCLALFGGTPGRWLYGISLRTNTGRRLLLGQAFDRTFRMVVQGMAGGILLVRLVTEFNAYLRLTRTGTTLWDTAAGTVVEHAEWGFFRTLVCTLAPILLITLLIVLRG